MSYMNPFSKIVTLTKRNHRYYGPTESKKMRGALTEIATDLGTIYSEINDIGSYSDAMASGFLYEDATENSLWNLKRYVYYLENRVDHMIYVQAKQIKILE